MSQVSVNSGGNTQGPSLSPFHIPPPPIIFSSPAQVKSLMSMDVDMPAPKPFWEAPTSWEPLKPQLLGEPWASIPAPPPIIISPPSQAVQEPTAIVIQPCPPPQMIQFASTPQQAPCAPPPSLHYCCHVSQGKADVQSLLNTFKGDLNGIMEKTFGTPSVQELVAPLPQELAPTPSSANEWWKWENFWWCHSCGKNFQGPSYYSCTICSWKVMVRFTAPDVVSNLTMLIQCHDCGTSGEVVGKHIEAHGVNHNMLKRTWGDPSPVVTPQVLSPVPRSPVPVIPSRSPSPSVTPQPIFVPRAPSPVMSPPAVVHVGIVCDMCNNTIVGVRHKCLDCPGKLYTIALLSALG